MKLFKQFQFQKIAVIMRHLVVKANRKPLLSFIATPLLAASVKVGSGFMVGSAES